MAYVLMQAFRQNCLAQTSLATATVGTIRLSLLKLGARITVSIRRIIIAIALLLSLSRYSSYRLPTYPITSCDWIIFSVGLSALTFLLN